MGLSNKQVGLKLLAKIQIYILTRAELLFTLCSEIPCNCKKWWYSKIAIIQVYTSFNIVLTAENFTWSSSMDNL